MRYQIPKIEDSTVFHAKSNVGYSLHSFIEDFGGYYMEYKSPEIENTLNLNFMPIVVFYILLS